MRRYLEQKRAASGVEINVTHVAMKATSLALREMRVIVLELLSLISVRMNQFRE